MASERHPGGIGAGKQYGFLFAFLGLAAGIGVLLSIQYREINSLLAMMEKRQSFFEKNIFEQATALNRVVFASGAFRTADAEAGAGFRGRLGPGLSLVNHARIPELIDPSSLDPFLGEDPLFLRERLQKSNEGYRDAVAEMGRLIEAADAAGDGDEGRRLMGDFSWAARDLHESLSARSALFMQIENVFYSEERKLQTEMQTLLRETANGFLLLTGLLAATAVLYLRSRLRIEAELERHRRGLEDLVAARTEELARANLRLTDALAEREMLVREVHHRVKNNLSMISGLISLQRSEAAEAGGIDSAFDGLAQRVQAIAMIHEQLYRSENLRSVSSRDYIDRLCRGLVDSLANPPGSVTLELDIHDAELPAEVLLNLGLVINELVVNALKHAFPGGRPGILRVRLAAEEDGYRLSVEDDGTPSPGASSILRSGSMGSVIVRGIIEQLGGTLSVDTTNGTRLSIRLPVSLAGRG